MKTTLGEIAVEGGIQTGPFGSQLHASDYTPAGVGVVMPQDLRGNVVSLKEMAFISRETASGLERHTLNAGDIVYSRRGDITRRALIRDDGPDLICGTGCLRVRINSEIADPAFVSYFLGLSTTHEWLHQHAVGATMPNLNTSILSAVPISLPDFAAQCAIGEVLGALDDKIAANCHVVATSDDLRSQMWRRACVSDRNEVPLSSLARFVNGRAFTKEASGTGRVVIRIAELNSGIGASTVRNDIEVADDHVARPGDLLLAWSGSLTSARWFREEAIVNQHIFKVVPDERSDMWAVASAVDSKMADFRETAKDKATTMGHIRRSDLDQPVGWPTMSPEVKAAGQNLWSRALSAEMENEVLTRTRDELLPLLMDGRITVKDAERAVEDVL